MDQLWVMLVAVMVAVAHLPLAHPAPVPEDPSLNDQTSSGDAVDTGPTIALGKDDIQESEFQIVQETKPTPAVVYKTMTPEIIRRRFTTASSTLPPVPPTTTFPTLPPRTTMLEIVMLHTTMKPLVNVDVGSSSTPAPETLPSTVSFTTVPVPEAVEASTVKSTTIQPSTVETDGPLLVGVNDNADKSTTVIPTKASTALVEESKATTLAAAGTTTKEDDGAIIVEVESEITEKVVLASTSTLASTVRESTEGDDGIIVDVVGIETKTQSSTTSEVPSTISTTLPPTTTSSTAVPIVETQPTTTSTEIPKVSTAASTVVIEVVQPVEVSSTVETTLSTKSTTITEKTTEDDGLIVVPGEKLDVGEENKLERNESTKILHSTKTGEDEQPSTASASPEILKSSAGGKNTRLGVMSDLITDRPPTPEVEVVEDDNVNATHIGESKEGGLSYAARTGIAMGCIVGFWIIIGPLVCLICKMRDKKRDKKEKEERDAREKANNSLVEEMVKAELQKTPNGDKKKMYEDDKLDDGEIEPITIGDTDSMPYMDADANSRDTAL